MVEARGLTDIDMNGIGAYFRVCLDEVEHLWVSALIAHKFLGLTCTDLHEKLDSECRLCTGSLSMKSNCGQ